MVCLASMFTLNSNKSKKYLLYSTIYIVVCKIFYFKNFSAALGTTQKIPIILSVWSPVIILSLFCSIGVIQINDIKSIKYIIAILIIFNIQKSYSEELFINASTVEIDKTGKIVYAKGNVEIFDKDKNVIYSDNAEYDKEKGIAKTIGPTRILTSEKYEVKGRYYLRR